MALEESILKSVKKNLGLDAGYTAFDHDVITHINTCFFTLNQLGVGPPEGYMIDGVEDKWNDFVATELTISARNALQTYIYLKVRSIFDPPGTPHHISAINEQIQELEHRLLTERELVMVGTQQLALETLGGLVIDGGES